MEPDSGVLRPECAHAPVFGPDRNPAQAWHSRERRTKAVVQICIGSNTYIKDAMHSDKKFIVTPRDSSD